MAFGDRWHSQPALPHAMISWLLIDNVVSEWEMKIETMYEFIKTQPKLLRPLNLDEKLPGAGFIILTSRNGLKIGVLNLMGNVFMKKCNDIFEEAKKIIKVVQLKKNTDFSSMS